MVASRTRSVRSFVVAVLAAIVMVAGLTTAASAAVLGSEPPDFAYPNAPTFTALLGSHTVTGSLGTRCRW